MKPGELQLLNLRLQQQQQLLGRPLRQPGLGPECQLCWEHAGSLVWSGEVRWQTADGLLRGSFKACGHLFTPPACAAAAGGSSSSEAYWLRYCQLPPVLEFVVGQRAGSFEEAVWQAPAAAGSTSRMREGWDLAPLALVPHSSGHLKQLQALMAVLRDEVEACKQGDYQIACGEVQLPTAAAAGSQLTGRCFIFHNPDGGSNKQQAFLETQLPPQHRLHWCAMAQQSSTSRTQQHYTRQGLLWDGVTPVCLMTTCWFVQQATGAAAAAAAAAADGSGWAAGGGRGQVALLICHRGRARPCRKRRGCTARL
ncbi:hypothetical protein COO60DRAFT_819005 [Scenedesmus sp. NREL 46B-D3]|nr:hypothetical protein COO60DRAFT_819005 [Scenedesmus sp. NREL 46B-D3]